MSNPTPAVTQAAQTAATAPSSANPTTAAAVASSNSPAGLTTSTTINSLADLKKKAPEVYDKMMQGIAMTICNEMKAHQERLKQLMRQGRS